MESKFTDNYYFIKIDFDLIGKKKKYTYICLSFKKIPENMFEFSQYLGFLLFLTILTIGFWLMFFLVAFVQYWIGGSLIELYKERKAKKKQEQAV